MRGAIRAVSTAALLMLSPALWTADGNRVISDFDQVEMDRAIAAARASLPEFFAAVRRSQAEYFAVKLGLQKDVGEGKEHCWVGRLVERETGWFGTMDNVPQDITRYRQGDVLPIDPSLISDWIVVDGAKIYGGFTTRVLNPQRNDAEKAAVEKYVWVDPHQPLP